MSRERLKIYDPFPPDLIDAAIKACIKDRVQRMILHYKLVDRYTYERIAEKLDMSPKRIQKIVYSAEDRLFRHLEISIKNDCDPG